MLWHTIWPVCCVLPDDRYWNKYFMFWKAPISVTLLTGNIRGCDWHIDGYCFSVVCVCGEMNIIPNGYYLYDVCLDIMHATNGYCLSGVCLCGEMNIILGLWGEMGLINHVWKLISTCDYIVNISFTESSGNWHACVQCISVGILVWYYAQHWQQPSIAIFIVIDLTCYGELV